MFYKIRCAIWGILNLGLCYIIYVRSGWGMLLLGLGIVAVILFLVDRKMRQKKVMGRNR